jgi:hypothetical protein
MFDGDMERDQHISRQSGNWAKAAPLMVRLSPAVRVAVEAAAAEERRSLSAIIDEIITRWAVSRATAESPL